MPIVLVGTGIEKIKISKYRFLRDNRKVKYVKALVGVRGRVFKFFAKS